MKSIDHCQLEKGIGLMKDKLGGKIMTDFVALRPKTYSYLIDHVNSHKKAKRTKKIIRIKDYKNCLLNNEIVLKS